MVKESSAVALPTRLGWVSFFNDASSEVIARAMPLFLVLLGMSPTFVGIVEGSAEASNIFLKGFSGWLSDQVKSRKPLVVVGYALSILARIALLLAYIPAMFAAIRIVDRSGKGVRTAPRDAMVADAAIAGKAGHAFGVTRFLDTLGGVVGIIIVLLLGVGAAPLSHYDFQIIIISSIPFGITALVLLIFWVPALPRQVKAKTYLALHIPKEVRAYLLIVFVFALGNSSDAFLVLRAQQLGFSFRDILLILVLFNLLAAALAVPVGKLSDRFGRVRFLASGWAMYGVAYIGIGMLHSSTMFVLLMCCYGAFYGLTEGIEKALLADLLPADKRGTGYGALQLVLGVAALPASFLTGYLMSRFGSAIAFSTAGLLALLGMLLLVLWRMTQKKQLTVNEELL